MNNTFKQLNDIIAKSEHKQFITYCYNNIKGQRLTCFAKRAGNYLFIKVYTLNPKEQFNKKYIKDYHNQNGFYSNNGILHVVQCNRMNYRDMFFEILSKYYFLNNDVVNEILEKYKRKNEKKNNKNIFKKPLMHIHV